MRVDEQRINQINAASGLTYLQVTDASPVAGHTLAERQLPPGVIIVSVSRAGRALLGAATVRLRPGDVVTILARHDQIPAVRALLAPE